VTTTDIAEGTLDGTHERVDDLGTVPRVGARAFLALDRVDVVWLVVLVGLAFFLRAASPIFPDALSHPFGGAPLTAFGAAYPQTPSACQDVPAGNNGSTQKFCGLVFDEVYFPVEAAKDLHQPAIDYFDPEPPLSMLLMSPPMAAFGFGNRWSWRLTVIIAGSLFVGLVYLIARRLRRDRFFAVCAGLFVCVDGLALSESRTGVIDMIAIFFVALVYYLFLLHWQARTRAQWRATLYLTAVAAGLGLAAKLNTIAPIVVMAGLVLGRALEPWALRSLALARRIRNGWGGESEMWRDAGGGGRAAVHYVAAVFLVGATFTACYSRYLTIEHTVYNYTGCDPQTGVQATSTLQKIPVTKLGSLTVPDIPVALSNVFGHYKSSLQYQNIECRRHQYESRWYTWPVDTKPVLFYADYASTTTPNGSPETGWIADSGNVALWWLAIPALLFCAWTMTRGPTWWRLGVITVGALGLILLIAGFNAAERGDTVRVYPGVVFYAGVLAIITFGIATVASAIVSRRFVPAFIVLGYLTAWLMWVFGNERRILFYYAMLGTLAFAAMALAYALTALRRTEVWISGASRSLAPFAYATIGLVIAAFVFFYPMWTGMPLPQADHNLRLWLPDW
jgi:dolichyl-phosphate-mannose-protein mannosyltransferase